MNALIVGICVALIICCMVLIIGCHVFQIIMRRREKAIARKRLEIYSNLLQ